MNDDLVFSMMKIFHRKERIAMNTTPQNNQSLGPQTSQPRGAQLSVPGRSGLAIASLVLGIIAIITSLLPIVNNLSFLLAILGVIFGIIGLVGISRGKKRGKGMAIAVLIINVVSFVLVLGSQTLYGQAINGATSQASQSVEQSATSETETASSSDSSSSEGYTISGEQFSEDDYGVRYIEATLTNSSDKDYEYVQVGYSLYDASGNKVGDAFANTSGLAPGKSWKLQALVTDETAESFELNDVTMW